MQGHMDASMQADLEAHIDALRKAADERTSFAQSLLNEATIFNNQAATLEAMIVDVTSINVIMASLKNSVNIIGNNDLNANRTWKSNRSAAYEALKTARIAVDTLNNNGEDTWEELRDCPGYTINNHYPYLIRNTKTKRIVSLTLGDDGYLTCNIGGKSKQMHKLVAQQWINNDDPEHKTIVDHFNHCRFDYHVDNLRWVTVSDNNKNASIKKGVKQEYIAVNDAPAGLIKVNDYNDHTFNNLYYHRDDNSSLTFYVLDSLGHQYRKLIVNSKGVVRAKDTKDKQVDISFNVFRKRYIH